MSSGVVFGETSVITSQLELGQDNKGWFVFPSRSCGTLPTYEEKLGQDMWNKGFVLDVQASPRFQHPMVNCSPCLLKTRCAQAGYYIPKLQRRLLSEEVARLQGLPHPVFAAMSALEGLSARALDAAAGDAMSVNVLMLALRRCCDSAGLTRLGPSRDFWLHCPADKCFELSDKLWEKYRRKK